MRGLGIVFMLFSTPTFYAQPRIFASLKSFCIGRPDRSTGDVGNCYDRIGWVIEPARNGRKSLDLRLASSYEFACYLLRFACNDRETLSFRLSKILFYEKPHFSWLTVVR